MRISKLLLVGIDIDLLIARLLRFWCLLVGILVNLSTYDCLHILGLLCLFDQGDFSINVVVFMAFPASKWDMLIVH